MNNIELNPYFALFIIFGIFFGLLHVAYLTYKETMSIQGNK